ncbi:hypothetical protein HZA86_00865 [Candidatus Uhrbacteria bacterium]|nr:hypothetical protein [Candidatus Uhrbacteria bacterium]
MKKTLTTTVVEINSQSVSLQLTTGETIALPASEIHDELKPGETLWLTVSTQQPNDVKEMLNTVLGAT